MTVENDNIYIRIDIKFYESGREREREGGNYIVVI